MPAPALLGGLAAFMARHAGTADDLFRRAFEGGGCRTTALLPVHVDAGNSVEVPRIAPLTLRSCKHAPGFVAEGGHGVEDTLLASSVYATRGEVGLLDALQVCPRCGNVLRSFRGYVGEVYASGSGSEPVYRSGPEPGRRVQTHVGIDRRRRGAAAQVLYAREVLDEQSEAGSERFAALVEGDDAVLRWLAGALTRPEATLRLGNALARGLGRCLVERFEPAPPLPSLEGRIEAFGRVFAGVPVEGVPIALTLETPALFVDPFLRPQLRPGGGDLLQERGSTPAEVEAEAVLGRLVRVHQVARPHQALGWNGRTRWPHRAEQGLEAGSVLLFAAPEVDDALVSALAHVEREGVGVRRGQGYGRVRVCDPIHTGLHEMRAARAAMEAVTA